MSNRNRIRNIEMEIKRLVKKESRTKWDCKFRLSDIEEKILSRYSIKNTYLIYQKSIKNFIRLIGDKKITMVNKSDLEDFKIKRSQEVNLVSTNIEIRSIKAIFKKLVEEEIIEYSKLSRVKQFKIKYVKVKAFETADIIRILNASKEKDVQMNQIIRLTLLTASRISEVLSIKVKDIDFDKGIINIYQQKTNCCKTIPLEGRLTELLKEILKSYIEGFDYSQKESYIFYSRSNNNPYTKLRADTVSKKFKKILRQLNLSEDFSFHCLRHTAITELILNNIPLNVVKEIAGHKSISTTMGYSHVRSEDMKQAVNSMNF